MLYINRSVVEELNMLIVKITKWNNSCNTNIWITIILIFEKLILIFSFLNNKYNMHKVKLLKNIGSYKMNTF